MKRCIYAVVLTSFVLICALKDMSDFSKLELLECQIATQDLLKDEGKCDISLFLSQIKEKEGRTCL